MFKVKRKKKTTCRKSQNAPVALVIFSHSSVPITLKRVDRASWGETIETKALRLRVFLFDLLSAVRNQGNSTNK